MNRLPITEKMVDRYLELQTKFYGKGTPQFREEFPGLFGKKDNNSITKLLNNRLFRRGIPTDFRSQEPAIHKAHTKYLDQRPELVVDFEPHFLVMSDSHFPLHHVGLMSRCARVISHHGIETMLWNGDQLDNAQKGHKNVHRSYAAGFDDGIEAWASVMDEFTRAGIRHHIIVPGNHDDKVWRDTDNEIPYSKWLVSALWDHLDTAPQWTVADRYYVIMRPCTEIPEPHMRTRSEHYPTRFTHQKNYSSNPLTVAKRLANRFLSNVCTGHQHHMGWTYTDNRKFLAVDLGTGQNTELAGFKNERDSAHPDWVPGFFTFRYGCPDPWPMDWSDAWWESRLS